MKQSTAYHRKKSRFRSKNHARSKNRSFPAAWSWRQRLAGLGGGILLAGVVGLALLRVIAPDTPRTIWLTLTHWVGFEVRAVYVIGRQTTSRDDILAAIDITIGEPLFRVEPETLRQAVETIGAVRSARVERRLDGSILLHLEERRPHALWRQPKHGEQSHHDYLVDQDGTIFAIRPMPRAALVHSWLPVLIGQQAPERAGDLLAALHAVPEIGRITVKAVNHHGRRWDLHLRNGIILQLPNANITESLHQVETINRQHDLLKRGIRYIDFRQPDRIRMTKGPAETSPETSMNRSNPDQGAVDPEAGQHNHPAPGAMKSAPRESRT